MKFHPILKRPTNLIPLSYEKFLFNRFNLRTSDVIENRIPQKPLINSIFGNLTTHLSVKNEDSNPSLFNCQTYKSKKYTNFDISNLNNDISQETKESFSSNRERLPESSSNSLISNEKIFETNNSSANNKDNIIDDLSKSNNLENHETLFRSNIKGYNIFDGRYSHLNEYRNESVKSIMSKGVDVPERLNCLIKERGVRGLTKECLEILSEMKKLKIPVSTETYNNCLIGCMKSNNAKLSRYLFLCLRSDILTPDLRTYTLMIKTHINAGDISSAFSLYKKMETEGTKADLVVFTVLIDCLVENRQINAAWELFNYMRTWRLIEPDEVLFTIMIKGCVLSREAEKALNLYQEMLTLKKYPTIYTYTELINCLSNRKEFFHQCFQFYKNIKSQEYPINEKIITYLLRSCCTVGNSRKARELLIESFHMKIKPTLNMYIIYIKTLAKQMKLYKLSDNEKINNINKTWTIVQTILNKNNLIVKENHENYIKENNLKQQNKNIMEGNNIIDSNRNTEMQNQNNNTNNSSCCNTEIIATEENNIKSSHQLQQNMIEQQKEISNEEINLMQHNINNETYKRSKYMDQGNNSNTIPEMKLLEMQNIAANSNTNQEMKILEMQNQNNSDTAADHSSNYNYFNNNRIKLDQQDNGKENIDVADNYFNKQQEEVQHNLLLQQQETNNITSNDKDITKLLNSVILVYENGNYYDYAIEVLNCFERFNAKPDYITYFILLRMLGPKMKDPGRFFALWSKAKTEIEPQRTLLCMALDMAILSRSAKKTLEILNDMYNAKVFPTNNLMKKLYESGKKITQIHVMINNLVTLQRKITYQEKLNENKILQTYIDEYELNKHIVPENQL